MISPSPEFPITKPGMHLQRKRDKPLRTYGRRQPPIADARTEPPAKKRKSTHDESESEDVKTAEKNAASATGPTTSPEQPGRDSGKAKPAKDSILNYFKRQPPPSAATSSGLTSGTCPEETTASPPSPPPISNRKRRTPRLLRIRPALLPELGEDEQHDDEDHGDSEKENRDQTKKGKEILKSVPRAEKTPSSENSKRSVDSPTASQAKTLRTKSKPTVQTTLNLSSRPAFDECRVCNTVWNPLCPDDVRYHSRRHATVVRRERDRR